MRVMNNLLVYEAIVREVEDRVSPEIERVRKGDLNLSDLVNVDKGTGLRILPHWMAQPYFRPSQPRKREQGDNISHGKRSDESKKESCLTSTSERKLPFETEAATQEQLLQP